MTNFGTYDGFGRRVKKGSRYYIYAGDKLLGEISGGAVDKVYTWGADGLVSQRLVGTNVSYWYHFGPQGETRHLTNSSGNVVGTYTYDAYGKQISTTGGINNNFRYGGKYGYYYDEQVYGMYLAGARWYAPDLYRWMSRDPIEYGGGDNMFAYVAGNPVKYVDPSGLDTIKYNDDTNTISLYDEDGNLIKTEKAYNRTPGYKYWPEGCYEYDSYASHGNPREANPNSEFGSHGIIKFRVEGRIGMGIHSGRMNKPRQTAHGTRGCVRTTDEFMESTVDKVPPDSLRPKMCGGGIPHIQELCISRSFCPKFTK